MQKLFLSYSFYTFLCKHVSVTDYMHVLVCVHMHQSKSESCPCSMQKVGSSTDAAGSDSMLQQQLFNDHQSTI